VAIQSLESFSFSRLVISHSADLFEAVECAADRAADGTQDHREDEGDENGQHGVEVQVLEPYRANVAAFVATLENMEVTPDQVAKVVLDERTGTIVIGENVRIATVAIAHGNLSIEIREEPQVSQPAPLSQGKTVVTPKSEVKVKEDKNQVILLSQAVTIRDLVRALNSIGATPRDLVAIFQAIKAAGALQAKLEIM